MKRSEYEAALLVSTLVVLSDMAFVQPRFTELTEEEVAEGKEPILLQAGFWYGTAQFNGTTGSYSGVESLEAAEEATQDDLVQVLKSKWTTTPAPWILFDGIVEEDA